MLTMENNKRVNKIRNLKVLDATERYELLTRLESFIAETYKIVSW